jgi:hypothetical protein
MLSEAARLARIRDQYAAIAPASWSRVHDGDQADAGCFVEALGPMGELSPVLRFCRGATDDEIAFVVDAPDSVRFLLGLVDRAIERMRPQREAERRPADTAPKDFAAECVMKCAEPVFRVFVEEKHGLEPPLTDERVAQKVRGLLGVTSRAELNQPGQAAERWKAMRGAFEAWRRAER